MPLECVTSFQCMTLNGIFGWVEGQNTTFVPKASYMSSIPTTKLDYEICLFIWLQHLQLSEQPEESHSLKHSDKKKSGLSLEVRTQTLCADSIFLTNNYDIILHHPILKGEMGATSEHPFPEQCHERLNMGPNTVSDNELFVCMYINH